MYGRELASDKPAPTTFPSLDFLRLRSDQEPFNFETAQISRGFLVSQEETAFQCIYRSGGIVRQRVRVDFPFPLSPSESNELDTLFAACKGAIGTLAANVNLVFSECNF